jgi:hypothetical protein
MEHSMTRTLKPLGNFGGLALALVAGLLSCLAPQPARAQSGIGDIIYTVGTTTRDPHGRDWAYILWQGTSPGLTSNRVFAVYLKAGEATNLAPYTRLSLVAQQTDPRVIEPLLERAANVGDDMIKLDQDIEQLFASFIPPASVTRADQLSGVIRGSVGNATYYQDLLLLARNHPGVDMALGFADAELIAPNSTNTFEVRAFDPVTSQDLAVIGRVTIYAGNPTILPPPGPPVQVPVPNAMGDLNLKFRWGTPDNLRRLGLMQFGFNLYRVEMNYANSQGWNASTPPPDGALLALAATNPADAKRVNTVPITPAAEFTVVDAANLLPPGDTNTTFIMDDDGRGRPGYTNYNWTNGAEFYYYVAGRDVLGRDGQLSLGLLGTVCERIPPLPPIGVHVVNDYEYSAATMSSNQALRVTWKQNLGTNDPVVNYWIYRWTNMAEMNLKSGNIYSNLIGVVSQIPNATNNSFLDNGAGSPSALGSYGETYWYTVRAGDAGACGQNLSQPAGPAYGVLRERVGPPPGTGYILINCLEPFVNFTGYTYAQIPSDTNNYHILLNCLQGDPRFDWADFLVQAIYTLPTGGSITISNYFGPQYFQGNGAVSNWWTIPHDPSGQGFTYSSIQIAAWCRAGLNNGKVSAYTEGQAAGPPTYASLIMNWDAVTESVRTTPSPLIGSAGYNYYPDCVENDPGGGGGGVAGTNNVCVHVFPTPGSYEYRFYRRVDNGPLTLLAAGAVSNLTDIAACDDNPPVNGGTMCFYVQLLDQNGNPSPMTELGCIDTAPVTPLATPVLAKITPIGTDPTNAQMSLYWFCPPYGVDRFEVDIAAKPTIPNTNLFVLSSQLVCTGAPPTPNSFTLKGTSYTNLPFYSYLTPRVGPAFGNNGAAFSVPCDIEVGKTYFVKVRALSQHGDSGNWSVYQSFIWSPSNTPPLQVPWPARPLPPTNANFFTFAFYLSPTNSDPLRAAAPSGNAVLVGFTNVGNYGYSVATNPPTVAGVFNPNLALETNTFGDSIFPCMLYRYQAPNANFPNVSGDVIQVSPLMENIAYRQVSIIGTAYEVYSVIADPFVAVTGLNSGSGNVVYLWIRDTQPQVSGASYKYILVHFDPVSHEIDQLIPSNETQVP